MSAQILQAVAFEDGGITLMARILGNAATAITQATLSSITLAVYEYASEQEAIDNTAGTVVSGQGGTLTISSVVYDTLQTGSIWTRDTTGYNFLYAAAATCMPTGGKWYRFEFKFTPSSGAAFWVVWVVEAKSLASS